MKFGLILSLLFLSTASAQDICNIEFLNKEAKAKTDVKKYENQAKQLGRVLYASDANDCSFIKEKLKDPNYVVIDARNMAVKSKVRGALRITSDHHSNDKHGFVSGKFETKVNKYMKAKGKTGDAKTTNYVLFCNGLTCYRTMWAACTLKKSGYKADKLNLILDGYDSLRKCL